MLYFSLVGISRIRFYDKFSAPGDSQAIALGLLKLCCNELYANLGIKWKNMDFVSLVRIRDFFCFPPSHLDS